MPENKTRQYFPSAFEYPEVWPLTDLTRIQKDSYQYFLTKGIGDILKEFSPINDYTGKKYSLYFLSHRLDEPKFDEETCREKNLTYQAALRVKVKLVDKEKNRTQTEEVYFGDIPLVTERGTFIINGIERAVVQQLLRSPGVFFTRDFNRGIPLYGAKVIPDRGSWIEFETDPKNIVWVRIDRRRKSVATALLRAFGLGTDEELLDTFKDELTYERGAEILKATMGKDPSSSEDEGMIEIYRHLRPNEPPVLDNARSFFQSMFFNPRRYSLGVAGRYKMNQRLGIKEDVTTTLLRKEDLVAIFKEIIRLSVEKGEPDDIDHLANRRLRVVGELCLSRFRIGMTRVERICLDKMSSITEKKVMPSQLISPHPLSNSIREFFALGQLSQFMDQTNPLAELEHKRRLTVVGPGGLKRERAGIEVRDVHPSFYGRICPITTSEGQNVGLVGHLATYALVNEKGFLVTPYRKVEKGKLTDKIVYLDAYEEEKYIIAPYSTKVYKNKIVEPYIEARVKGRPGFCHREEVDFIDVANNQIVSSASSLIPFLEHDDGVRALMGTNMQRQAVPLILPEAPLVGTGMEKHIALNSGYTVYADKTAKITELDGGEITLKDSSGHKQTIKLKKYTRSNYDTCLSQTISQDLDVGKTVKKGDLLVDGPAMEKGELALGRNLLCAFIPWKGYNYEDAIIISSRLVEEDILTSIHIKEYTVDVRNTRFGEEVTTRDIPNVSQEKLANLDEDGIIRLGAEVKSGDILVGKITPKGETELSAEEKLLQAIFGEKIRDVRDTSLYLEHGEHGRVIGIKVFSREAGDKLEPGVIKSITVCVADMRKIQVGDKMANRHGNKGVISKIVPKEDMPYLEDGRVVDIILNPLGVISRMNLGQILEMALGLAAEKLGYKVATPIFSGIKEEEIQQELIKAGFRPDGKMKVYDGLTGEPYSEPIAVGYMYMMKLNHLVEDKIHQRSIGPYSLITQQPLGGRAQSGGQRFGEMEVWALEGYGAAYTLQEMLTIKSDDVPGRISAYESIIRGEPIQEVNIPESFNILIRELKGLCLDVQIEKEYN